MKTKRTLFQLSLILSGALTFFACNSSMDDSPSGTPPSALTYSPDTMVFAVEVADSGIGPNVTGTVTSYTISPSLPAGLTLDSAQGNIWGQATIPSPPTNYIVTAKNSSGSTSITVSIVVSKLDTTLTGLVQDIFSNNCTNCHKPGGTGYLATGGVNGGLDLSVGKSYANLINQPTFEAPTEAPFLRVKSGFADSSYVYQKIASGSPKSGLRMPQDGPPYLTSDEIAIIQRWIQLGVPQ